MRQSYINIEFNISNRFKECNKMFEFDEITFRFTVVTINQNCFVKFNASPCIKKMNCATKIKVEKKCFQKALLTLHI